MCSVHISKNKRSKWGRKNIILSTNSIYSKLLSELTLRVQLSKILNMQFFFLFIPCLILCIQNFGDGWSLYQPAPLLKYIPACLLSQIHGFIAWTEMYRIGIFSFKNVCSNKEKIISCLYYKQAICVQLYLSLIHI